MLFLQNYAEKYAEDPAAFFKDYAEAHAKLSNLGAKFDPPEVYIHAEENRDNVLASYFVCYYHYEPCICLKLATTY